MDSAHQLPLQFKAASPSLAQLRASSQAKEPRIWVERLAIHKDWPPTAETLLRSVELRKGLNIVWAESKPSAGGSRLGGHGAGKTTFCRLLRYVLGDPQPGKKSFRENFRRSFTNGWVLADVWVDGARWLVGRPLGERGYHPFALSGGTLLEPLNESLPRGAFDAYKAAVESALLSELPKRKLSGSGADLNWQMLLPWLSRDQEAHYAGLTEWRAKDSDSDSPDLSAPDRENLMRLVLGLVDDQEQEKLREREKAAQEHERLTRERPRREYHIQQAQERLEELFGDKVGNPGELLLQHAIQKRVSDLRHQTSQALIGLQEDEELKRLVRDEAERNLEMEFFEDRADELTTAVAKQKGTTLATGSQASAARHYRAPSSFLPFRGFCSTLITEARRKGCPCITERPEDDVVQRKTEAIVETADEEKARLAAMESDLVEIQTELAKRKQAHAAASAAVVARRAVLNERIAELSKPQQIAADLQAAFDAYSKAEINVQDLTVNLEQLDKSKKQLDEELEVLARQHRERISLFTDLFDAVVKAMLGNEVTGRVEFSGKSLNPALEFHGSFDSAALSLTKLLAFDLASLGLSLFHGIGHHPRFLLHDSPREADLFVEIYRSLFVTAWEFEQACGDSPGFQYIITTTEPPPDDLQTAPWLVQPKLDATKAETRFLGVDLG